MNAMQSTGWCIQMLVCAALLRPGQVLGWCLSPSAGGGEGKQEEGRSFTAFVFHTENCDGIPCEREFLGKMFYFTLTVVISEEKHTTWIAEKLLLVLEDDQIWNCFVWLMHLFFFLQLYQLVSKKNPKPTFLHTL